MFLQVLNELRYHCLLGNLPILTGYFLLQSTSSYALFWTLSQLSEALPSPFFIDIVEDVYLIFLVSTYPLVQAVGGLVSQAC